MDSNPVGILFARHGSGRSANRSTKKYAQIEAGQFQPAGAGCEIMKPDRSRPRWKCRERLAPGRNSRHRLGLILCKPDPNHAHFRVQSAIMNALHRMHRVGWVFLGLFLLWGFVACSCSGELAGSNSIVATPVKAQNRDWKKFINECISKVEKSEAVFYRRGERVSGKEVAQEMRQYLSHILRTGIIPDPYGRNAGILLAAITTHEGIYMDGLTGKPEPILIEIEGKRIKLYDWLKQEFGVAALPGEEPGHQVFEMLYETELDSALLAQWERYIDKCIEVVRGAKDVTFLLKEQVWSPVDVVAMMESNRADAIRELKSPDIKDRDDRRRYNAGWILVRLTRVPEPKRESFSDQTQYSIALTGLSLVKERNGTQELFPRWVESKAGEPPPMPKLKQRRN
jgi:hypothetical protein